MDTTDITIIGAGVIGLASAYQLSTLNKDILVIDKNSSFGQETSSRNSEVIHSGIYYPKKSLKTKTCIRGKDLLYDLCLKHGIPHKKLGKILIATNETEILRLHEIHRNAADCGIKSLRILEKNELRGLEKNITSELSILSHETGIIDSHSLMDFLYTRSKANKTTFAFSIEVTHIERHGSSYKVTVKEPGGDSFSFETKVIINCAGLYADKIVEMAGIRNKTNYKIFYCKGQYFRIRNPKKFGITHLIYPPPTKVSLGIHITPDLAGGLRLGPDAEYVSSIEYSVRESDKNKFFNDTVKFLPSLKNTDLIPDISGIRPKLHTTETKFADFVIKDEIAAGHPNFISTLGIESPGLTSCLAIGEMIRDMIADKI